MYQINLHWTSRTVCSLISLNILLLSRGTYRFQTHKPKAITDHSSHLAVHLWLFHWEIFTLILCLLFFLRPLKCKQCSQDPSNGLPVGRAGPRCCCSPEGPHALAWTQGLQSRRVRTHSHSSTEDGSASRETVLEARWSSWGPKPRQWPWR